MNTPSGKKVSKLAPKTEPITFLVTESRREVAKDAWLIILVSWNTVAVISIKFMETALVHKAISKVDEYSK